MYLQQRSLLSHTNLHNIYLFNYLKDKMTHLRVKTA